MPHGELRAIRAAPAFARTASKLGLLRGRDPAHQRAARRARKVCARQVSAPPPSRAAGRGAPVGTATSVAAVSAADKWRRPVAATRACGWGTRRAGPPGARRLSGRNGSCGGGAQRGAVFPGPPLENRCGPAALDRVGPARGVEDAPRMENGLHAVVLDESVRPDFKVYTDRRDFLMHRCRAQARNLNLVGAALLKSEFWARRTPNSSPGARTGAGAQDKNGWTTATVPRIEMREDGRRRASRHPPTATTVDSPLRQGTLPGVRCDLTLRISRACRGLREWRTPRCHPFVSCARQQRSPRGWPAAPPPQPAPATPR